MTGRQEALWVEAVHAKGGFVDAWSEEVFIGT